MSVMVQGDLLGQYCATAEICNTAPKQQVAVQPQISSTNREKLPSNQAACFGECHYLFVMLTYMCK